MKLSNPLKSLTWNSLFRSSRSRLRRRRPNNAPINLAAEVLEERRLLAATVSVSVGAGGLLTLTSNTTSADSIDIDVYRNSSGQVEIDALSGSITNPNSGGSYVFSGPVSGIIVKMGAGFDNYTVESKSGDPALNIGAGGILFKLNSGVSSSIGDNFNIYNNSSSPMTILGSIIVQGQTPGSALAHTGSGSTSLFDLSTGNSGNLTIFGSVVARMSGSGSQGQDIEIDTDGSGNLNILGSVTESLTQTGNAFLENEIRTEGSGNITIGLGVTQSATGGTNTSENVIETDDAGNIKIGLGVTQTASNASFAENYVEVDNSGSIAIMLGVSQTGTGTADESEVHNEVDTFGSGASGNIKIVGSVTQTGTADDYVNNFIQTDNSGSGGNITIGGFVKETGTVTESDADVGAGQLFNDVVVGEDATGNITIVGAVFQTGTSTEYLENQVYGEPGATGSIKVGGLITMKSTTSGTGSFGSNNEVFTEGGTGTVSALGVVINDTGSQPMDNYVFSQVGAVTIGLGGVTIIGSGSGYHDNEIFATGDSGSSLHIAGSVIVTDSASGSGNQFLAIYGNTYIGGALLVTMNGTNAEIEINADAGLGTVEVKGLFHATMLGSGALIVAGDPVDSGTSLVKFDSGVTLLGSSGAGATFEKEPGVSALFVVPVFFATPST